MAKPGAGKKSAKDSLAKLSKGLTRETPATRAGVVADGGENGAEAPPVAQPGNLAEEASGRLGRPRTKPERMVRVSVDVVRSDHKYLRDVAYDTETDAMSVMRALLRRMKADADLEDRIRDDLANL